MALSFEKLTQLLNEQRFIQHTFFVNNEYNCLFIHIRKDMTDFLLYIPSKYDIKIETGNIKIVELIESNKDSDNEEDDEKEEEVVHPDSVNKYLTHMLPTVKASTYKVSVLTNNILYLINRYNDVVKYNIITTDHTDKHNEVPDTYKKIMVTTDIEVMIDKKKMFEDIINLTKRLQTSFYTYYSSNVTSITALQKLQKNDIDLIKEKMKDYDNYIARLEKIYDVVLHKEYKYRKRIKLFSKTTDANNINEKEQTKKEYEKLLFTKDRVVHYFNEVVMGRDMMVIEYQTLMLENDELYGKLTENISKLKMNKN